MRKIILPIDSKDNHAIALGRFTAHWALVEVGLQDILMALLRIDQSRAQILYLAFSALGTKFKLARRLIYAYLDDSKDKTSLLQLIGDMQKLSDTRNTYAHATWAEGRDDTLTMGHGTPPSNAKDRLKDAQTITAEDIQADVGKVDALLLRLEEFQFHVLPTMPIRDLPRS